MDRRIMYSTKIRESQIERLRQISSKTKIPQTKLIEDALLMLFQKHDDINRKLEATQ